MDELLQKLLEADVLSEDTKKELEEAFQGKLEEAIETAKSEAAADVRAELTEQWVGEREALVEAVDKKVDAFLATEMSELKSDVENYRDIEAEYAEKLVEAKAQMADELKGDLAELVERLDAFLEIRLNQEIEELREDIDEVKKNEMGRRIFEAVADEYAAYYADDESLEGNLRETEQRLEDTVSALTEAENRIAEMERTQKMKEVLSPLSGRSREVMSAILDKVPTEQLEEGYNTFITRVLKEADETTSEKEDEVLAEGDESSDEQVVVTGDNDVLKEEEEKEKEGQHLSEDTRKRLKYLAGL